MNSYVLMTPPGAKIKASVIYGDLMNNTDSKTLKYWKLTRIGVPSSTASPDEFAGCRFISFSVRSQRITALSMACLTVFNHYYRVYIQLEVKQVVRDLTTHLAEAKTAWMEKFSII